MKATANNRIEVCLLLESVSELHDLARCVQSGCFAMGSSDRVQDEWAYYETLCDLREQLEGLISEFDA